MTDKLKKLYIIKFLRLKIHYITNIEYYSFIIQSIQRLFICQIFIEES
jgi:hypothetical protein